MIEWRKIYVALHSNYGYSIFDLLDYIFDVQRGVYDGVDCRRYIGVKDGEMSLSKQIGVISGTDSSLSNQHKDIEKFLKEDIEFKLKQTMTYSSDAYRLIETERQLREQREKLLNCDESKLSQAIDDISAFKNLWVEKNYRIQQLSEQVIQLQEERQSLERTINEKNNEINKLKEQIEKYRYSRDDKQTLYR